MIFLICACIYLHTNIFLSMFTICLSARTTILTIENYNLIKIDIFLSMCISTIRQNYWHNIFSVGLNWDLKKKKNTFCSLINAICWKEICFFRWNTFPFFTSMNKPYTNWSKVSAALKSRNTHNIVYLIHVQLFELFETSSIFITATLKDGRKGINSLGCKIKREKKY